MSRLPAVSGKDLIKILTKRFGFRVLRQRGSHVTLTNDSSFITVPLHPELDEPTIEWTGRLAGIDINPEGIACTVASGDGNLVATRFFRDRRLVTASKDKRRWVLEDIVNRMLRWCRDTLGCNAVAVERLRFMGAYDRSPRMNFKLSNFMKNKLVLPAAKG
ncbi:MAG: type II toxin-antitoxin system HicA family toxin [Nitrososphaerota archaeon]|nr:type II toxin-antitoxin system HicA family toxin [Nitrososphaerota archaeon]